MTHQNFVTVSRSDPPARNPVWLMLQATLVFALLFLLAPAAWSATYYVANNGNDAASGTTLTTPFKTIQKAMNTAVAGDTVYVRGGTYREEVNVFRGGGSAGKYVSVFAYNNETPVIKGSDLVTGWVKHSGNIWKKTGWTVNSQQVFDGSRDGPSLQQIGMPSRFYTSYTYPKQVGSGLSSMIPGSFYYDAAATTLYIWLADGSDPNTKPIEVSTRRRLFFMGRPYIHLKGFAFRHSSASAFGEQGSAVELSSYSIIENSDIQYVDFSGLGMGYQQTGALAINCNVSNNGNSGINAPASYDFRVSHCRMNNNNTRNFELLWHAGGFKAATDAYGVVEYSEAGNNNGSGIWFDYANSGKPIVIKNNYVHDNGPKDSAIFFEVSTNGLIYNNVIVNNERRGIYLSAADNTRVYNNTIVGTKTYAGIEVGGMPRSGATLTNNAVYNNVISNGTTNYDLVIAPANGSSIAGNSSDYNNIYRASGSIKMTSGTNYTDLAAWRKATKMDEHSISADPKFVVPFPSLVTASTQAGPAANYGMQSTSPLIDTGMVISAVTDDYATTLRKTDNPYDIGAFEFAGAPSAPSTESTAPVITMSSPAQDNMKFASGIVTINVSAKDDVAVTGLNLYANGQLVAQSSGQPLSYTWDMRSLRKGTHTIYVSAVDAKRNLTKLFRSVKNYDDTPTTSTGDTGSTGGTGSTGDTGTTGGTGSTGGDTGSTGDADSTAGTGTTPTQTTAPVITMSSPAQDNMKFANGMVTINVSAKDDVAVTGLNLYVNGQAVVRTNGEPISYTWDMRSLRKGTHTIYVSAVDAKRNLTKLFRSVKNYDDTPTTSTGATGSTTGDTGSTGGTSTTPTQDVTAPAITISSPSQDYMSFKDGKVTINVSATDNVAVTGLNLYVDGQVVARTDGDPISYTWDMGDLRLGTHTIYASAVDARRNLGKLFRPVRNY